MIVERERLGSLDSLRGIAALTVVFSHLNLEYLNLGTIAPYIQRSVLHVFYDGEAAVVFFFVLSGFVLSYKYFRTEKFDTFSYGSFLISRFFRIYPILWAVLALTAIVGALLPHQFPTTPMRQWTFYWWHEKFDLYSFLSQMSIVFKDPSLANDYIPQSWTLKVEVVLSALVPIFILIARKKSSWLILLNLILIIVFDMWGYIIHFSMGVLLAKYMPDIKLYMAGKSKRFKIVALFMGIILYSYRYSVAIFFSHKGFFGNFFFGDFGLGINFIIGMGVAMIMISVLTSTRLERSLNKPTMLSLGRISYSLYLSHLIIFVIVNPLLIRGLNMVGITSTIVVIPVVVISTVFASIALAYFLYSTVESWSIKIGKKASSFWPIQKPGKISVS